MGRRMGRREQAPAVEITRELRHLWLVPVLGVLYFLAVGLSRHGMNKPTVMALLIAAILTALVRAAQLTRRMTWPALLLGLYVCMDGISTLYAPSGKFALYEFLKVMLAACLALLLVAWEPRRDAGRTGRCAATVLEVSAALASFVSLDMVATRWFYRVLCDITAWVGTPVVVGGTLQEERLRTIFGNPNVFAGAAGIVILLSLGLAVSAESRKERCVHLSCLLLNSTVFLLAMSRGAIGAIAAAFLAYLLLERDERRARVFVLMVETLLLAAASSLAVLQAYPHLGEGIQLLPLLAVVIAAEVLCLLDIFAGRPLAQCMARRMKTVNIVLLAALGAAIVGAVVAVNWTGELELKRDQGVTRGAYLGAGTYTLQVEASGPVTVQIEAQTDEDAVMNRKQTVYQGEADGAVFTLPEGNRSATFRISAETPVCISSIRYEGDAAGGLKLKYKLLPEAIAGRIQNLRSEGNVVQRFVYISDAMKLFRKSPVTGLGMGAFENGIYSVQAYHYETKYVHNHYVQTMVDTGILGLALWLGLLGASAAAVIRLWRRRTEERTMGAALCAMLLFIMIHAAVEVDFSSSYSLPYGFGAFAVIELFCGDMVPLRLSGKTVRRCMVWAETLGLLVFAVLLGMNLRAASLAEEGSYTAMEKAAALDPYEWVDHELAYVYSAAAEEELPASMQNTMTKYLADLEKLHSNSVPRYLAKIYFSMGNIDKAFEVLNQYVDYVPSNPEAWNGAFGIILEYDDGSETFRQGIAQLWKKLERWNQQNLGAVSLSKDVTAYLAGRLGAA